MATMASGGEPDWAAAELAVHAYDLSAALGRTTGTLDPEVAEAGHVFMTASMTDDMRGNAFGPEQSAPAAESSHRFDPLDGVEPNVRHPCEFGPACPRTRRNGVKAILGTL